MILPVTGYQKTPKCHFSSRNPQILISKTALSPKNDTKTQIEVSSKFEQKNMHGTDPKHVTVLEVKPRVKYRCCSHINQEWARRPVSTL